MVISRPIEWYGFGRPAGRPYRILKFQETRDFFVGATCRSPKYGSRKGTGK